MIYKSESINNVMNEINIKYFLPHIQRKMVWNDKQIYKLFDSLLRGYPISTFLFWKITGEYRNEVQKMKFIENYYKNSLNETNTNTNKDEYLLVLDGQQRLQSLYLSLIGTFNEKELYFNVLSNPNKDPFDDEDILYETKFLKSKENKNFNKDKNKLWIKVKEFVFLDSDKIYDYCYNLSKDLEKEISLSDSKLIEVNIKKFNDVCMKEGVISYFLETENNYDKVLDIFIRTNSGGTKLNKADLLFSIIKLRWQDINAYEQFNKLLVEINNDSFNFDNDFLLKTCLVLINEEIKYRVDNFSKENIFKIEKNWLKIRKSIVATIELIKEFGILNKRTLMSKNAIIPIINYTYINQINTYAITDDETFIQNKESIKNWLFAILLNNIFSSQTDELLTKFRTVLINNGKNNFPALKLNEVLPLGKSLSYKKTDFDKLTYSDKQSFFILGILYSNFNLISKNQYSKPNIDHLFSQNQLSSSKEYSYTKDEIDNIGNLGFLSVTNNTSKNKMPFEEWIKVIDNSKRENHYIPKEENLCKIENYRNFLEKRRELMFNKLQENMGLIK